MFCGDSLCITQRKFSVERVEKRVWVFMLGWQGGVINVFWEFPGGPVVRTLGFHCYGPGSIPGQGTETSQCLGSTCTHSYI